MSPAATRAAALQVGIRACERISPGGPPSRAVAQWPRDPPCLTYRCGGSAGLIPYGYRLPVSLPGSTWIGGTPERPVSVPLNGATVNALKGTEAAPRGRAPTPTRTRTAQTDCGCAAPLPERAYVTLSGRCAGVGQQCAGCDTNRRKPCVLRRCCGRERRRNSTT